MLIIYNV